MGYHDNYKNRIELVQGTLDMLILVIIPRCMRVSWSQRQPKSTLKESI